MMSERIGSDNTGERKLAQLKELAASLPKVEQVEADSPRTHTQYRDNFFQRFGELRAIRDEVATDAQVFYVRMVKERFGFDLLTFYDEHPRLCDAICDAVDDKEPYDQLVAGYYELLDQEQAGEVPVGSADGLNVAVDHPLGIEAIGMYYWGRINPLLEEAYGLMDAQTLNAPFLTR
jgi:hypothetical protein